jgi:hypothetical protein
VISLAASRSTWPAYQAYFAQTGAHLIQASADTTSPLTGRWWLLNPVLSTVRLFVTRVDFTSQHGSVLATPTSPRVTLERMTFTGTPSGASVTPATALSGAPAASGTLRTATTGFTPAAGAALHAFMPAAALTPVGAVSLGEDDFTPDEPIELTAGQGIVCRQPDAGTTGDTRRFATTVHWIEV